MPNWCYNRMTIECDDDYREKILNFVKEDDSVFSLNAIIPMPNGVYTGSLSEEVKRIYPGLLNWYDWRSYFWGTKWPERESNLLEDGTILFVTAWEPPIPALLALSKYFPKAKFLVNASDDMLNFCVDIEFKDGEIISEKEIPIKFDTL